MRKISLCLIICCLYFVFPGASAAHSTGNEDAVQGFHAESGYSIPRLIQYSFTLQNKTNRLLENAEFWAYAPVKETATQRTVKLEASHPYQLISDDLGNQVLHFKLKTLPPYATMIITIKAFLELSDISNPVSAQDLQPFLQPEKYIESDNAELFRFAKKFISHKPVKTAQNIFRWVADNLEYTGYLRDNYGALYAYKNRKGDCTEFMSLFIALSRANNIPARGIGGYVTVNNAILKPYEYHNWAEFFDGDTWNIVDPQNRVFMQDRSHYIAMRVIGESPENPMGEFNKFRYSGDGLKVKMNK